MKYQSILWNDGIVFIPVLNKTYYLTKPNGWSFYIIGEKNG